MTQSCFYYLSRWNEIEPPEKLILKNEQFSIQIIVSEHDYPLKTERCFWKRSRPSVKNGRRIFYLCYAPSVCAQHYYHQHLSQWHIWPWGSEAELQPENCNRTREGNFDGINTNSFPAFSMSWWLCLRVRAEVNTSRWGRGEEGSGSILIIKQVSPMNIWCAAAAAVFLRLKER